MVFSGRGKLEQDRWKHLESQVFRPEHMAREIWQISRMEKLVFSIAFRYVDSAALDSKTKHISQKEWKRTGRKILISATKMWFLLKSMGVACLYGLWKGKKKSKDCSKKIMFTFEMEELHPSYLMILCLFCSFRKNSVRTAVEVDRLRFGGWVGKMFLVDLIAAALSEHISCNP